MEYEVHARTVRYGTSDLEVINWLVSDWQSVSGTAGEPKTVLTVTPSGPTRDYGGSDDLSYTVSGLATGDTAAAVVTGALSRATGDDAGDYAIGMGTLAIASGYAQKYELPSSPAITTYSITPRAVTSSQRGDGGVPRRRRKHGRHLRHRQRGWNRGWWRRSLRTSAPGAWS